MGECSEKRSDAFRCDKLKRMLFEGVFATGTGLIALHVRSENR